MKIITILTFALIILFVNGCKNDESVSTLKGDLVGFVNLVENDGSELYNKNGVNISIENTAITQTTDQFGRFLFTDLISGTYKSRP